MELKIKKTFDFAHRGIDVVRYEKGKTVTADDPELVRVAVDEKWAEPVKAKAAAADNKSQGNAPENKQAGADGDGEQDPDGQDGSGTAAENGQTGNLPLDSAGAAS